MSYKEDSVKSMIENMELEMKKRRCEQYYKDWKVEEEQEI